MQCWKTNITKRLKESESNIKVNWNQSKEEAMEMFMRWEEKSAHFIKEFVTLFGKDNSDKSSE